MEENTKDEKIKYEVFSLRLDERTKKKLIEKRIESGLSWNRFLLKLLNNKK